MTNELTTDAFASWARAVGLSVGAERIGLLQSEVEALLARIAPLGEFDVADIAIEDAIGGAS